VLKNLEEELLKIRSGSYEKYGDEISEEVKQVLKELGYDK